MKYDYIVMGAGLAGLTVGALLAKAGKKVCLIEGHKRPGGHCHSFKKKEFTFCALGYAVSDCGEGEIVNQILTKLGLQNVVTFERMDQSGYDHFSCPSEKLYFKIPNSVSNWEDQLKRHFPADKEGITDFFKIIYAKKIQSGTLQKLFDESKLSPEVEAILATQVADCGLSPKEVSLSAYVDLIRSHSAGAYYPTKHFKQFMNSLVQIIHDAPGCDTHFKTEIESIQVVDSHIAAVVSKEGHEFSANNFICTFDPKKFSQMAGEHFFPSSFRAALDYRYSSSVFTVFMGLKGIDLRDYGFGAWRIWHYPKLRWENNILDPWFFMTTPTLQSGYAEGEPEGICPKGGQILEAVTLCPYDHFKERLDLNRASYVEEKEKLKERIIDSIAKHYIPDLRKYLDVHFAGTPTTVARYLRAPQGNVYGAELTPKNYSHQLKLQNPMPNLFFTRPLTPLPGVGPNMTGGSQLYSDLIKNHPENRP